MLKIVHKSRKIVEKWVKMKLEYEKIVQNDRKLGKNLKKKPVNKYEKWTEIKKKIGN